MGFAPLNPSYELPVEQGSVKRFCLVEFRGAELDMHKWIGHHRSPSSIACDRIKLEPARPLRPPQKAGPGAPGYTVGRMFWLRRNRFVGSYLFFKATSRW
jgi:hypothetical protein